MSILEVEHIRKTFEHTQVLQDNRDRLFLLLVLQAAAKPRCCAV